MPIFPDPDALQWIAGTAAAGGVLFFALTLNKEMGWLALSSEPDPEPPPVTLPDDREASASLAGKLLKAALWGAATGAGVAASVNVAADVQWYVGLAIAAVPAIVALRTLALIDVSGPAVGEQVEEEAEFHWDNILDKPFWRSAGGLLLALFTLLAAIMMR